jgi:hypothetical protein
VITVKDLNTGVTKEVCTKSKFLSGALYREHGDFDLSKYKPRRYFEFRNRKALENLRFFDYQQSELKKVAAEFNIRAITDTIEYNGSWEHNFRGKEHPKIEYLAHLLFNQGYLTYENSCWGGTLHYTRRNALGKYP